MKWIFSIKTDSTYMARLVERGDLMISWIDFNPKEMYYGNILACGIKVFLAIAALYKLRMRGLNLVGAYLVTRANQRGRTSRLNSTNASRRWVTKIPLGI